MAAGNHAKVQQYRARTFAALCGAVASAGGIESQNVVGYQEMGVPKGSSMRTAMFKAMSGDYKISDIKVDGAVGGGGDYAQKINADGTWGGQYFYFIVDGMGVTKDGWYKDEFGEEVVSDTDALVIGEALMMTAESDFTVTYCGEVIKGVPSVSVPQGASMVGNPTPINTKISDINVSDAVGGGGDYIQKINADGTWGDQYFYFTVDGMGVAKDGWYKDEFGEEAVGDGDMLKAGESVMFTAESAIALEFPAVLK